MKDEIGGFISLDQALEAISNCPTIDVVRVAHGRWVDDEGKQVEWDENNPGCPARSCYCSICGDWLTASDEYPVRGIYCPNCGVNMT